MTTSITESSTDFFISYTGADSDWAEWIAWILEAAGYQTLIQAWDFLAGENFVQRMNHGASNARQTVAVLSPEYLTSGFAQSEWNAAFAQDPTGAKRILVPVRVRKCDVKGLLPQVIFVDLVDADESMAKGRLLEAVSGKRKKPTMPPSFPGPRTTKPLYPGSYSALADSDDVQRGDSAEPDGEGGIATATEMQSIELTIDREFEHYTREEQEILLEAIKNLLEVNTDVRITRRRANSVKLTLELPPDQAERLLWLARGGALDELGVTNAEFVSVAPENDRRDTSDSTPVEDYVDEVQLDVASVAEETEKLRGNLYEGMFLVDSDRYSRDPGATVEHILGILKRCDANVVAHRPWRDGKLAYPVKGRHKGLHYVVFFAAPGQSMMEIAQACRMSETILRQLLLKHQKPVFDACVAQLRTT